MSWRERAACRGMNPELFFPTHGETTENAKRVCASCQVRADCLAAGMMEKFGVWGGESEKGRRVLRRGQPRSEPAHGRRTRYALGCRCVECCLADSVYKRAYRRRVA